MVKKIFTVLFFAGLALQGYAASVKPLYFVYDDTTFVDKYDTTFVIDTTTDAENNEVYDTTGIASIDTRQVVSGVEQKNIADAKQQDYWDYLMKFKLWGTNGISMGNDVSLPDSSGWSGAAHHGLTGTARDLLGGPVIVNDDIALGDQSKILKGPIRTTGNFTAGNDNGGHAFYGPVCVGGTVNDQAQRGIDRAGSTLLTGASATTGVCSEENVPFIRSDLQIPLLPTSTYSGDVSVDGGKVGFIDVPPGSGSSDMYDLYLNSISIGNEGTLYIRMPYGGRLTRIFLKSLSFGTHPTIQVSYMGADAVFEGGTYTSTGDTLIRGISQYDGNLMFYVPHDINFVNTDNRPVQGTFISTGTITMACNMQFAGQLLANKLVLGNNIDGSGFVYVPFDPPEIDIEGLVNNVKFPENDNYVKIPVTLTKTPETDVYIDYCFYEGSAGGASNGAEMSDIGPAGGTPTYSMPDCSLGETRRITIPAGYRTAQQDDDNAWIYVRTDDLVEGDELLVFYVMKISGAVIKGNATNGGVFLTLVDTNKNPPELADNTSLAVNENDAGASVGQITVTDPDGDDITNVEIVGGTGADLFTIDNDGNISLKADSSLNYEVTQSYTVDVKATDADGKSTTKTYTINVGDVNEEPFAYIRQIENSICNYKVSENPVDGEVLPGFVKIKDIDSLEYADGAAHSEYVIYNAIEAVAGDTAIFGILKATDSTYSVYVKYGDSLDYEKDSLYSLKLRIYDEKVPTLFSDTTIYIGIKDVKDPPVIVTKDSTVIIPNDPLDPDTLKNVGSDKAVVDENNDAGAKAGIVIATCTDTTKTLHYEIVSDTSGLFAIDDQTGIVTVKDDSVLDYEQVKSYGITVKVSDGVAVSTNVNGDAIDANGVIVQSAEKDMVINVGDVNENPILTKQTFEIKEHNGAGAGVDQYGMADSTNNKYWIAVSDVDKVKEFTQHTLTVVGGDSALFYLGGDQGDEILAKGELDFETYAATGDTAFTLIIKATDKEPGPNGEELYAIDTMTIILKNINETPKIVTDTLYVTENSKGGTAVDTLEADDPDGAADKLTYELSGTSTWFDVADDGTVTVKDDAGINYEKTATGTVSVKVTDASGATTTKKLVVVVIDENEAPTVQDTTFTVREDASVGTEVGHVVATDPDTKNPDYGTLTYKQLTDSDKFQVLTDGTVKLIDSLDYEADSVYTLKVLVTDGTYNDTALVTVKVGNVIEKSEVKIVTAINEDSTWHEPDTIYVNRYDIDIVWTEDGNERRGDTTLTEGKNIIIKTFQDPSKDIPGCDTLIVYVSTATPIVTVTRAANTVEAENIYTIVEDIPDTSSSTFYVNNTKSDIKVTVTDPVDSTKSTSFTLALNLSEDKLPEISSSTYKTLDEVVDATPALNYDAENAIHTPVNGEKVAVSYTDTIAGQPVTVTYYTDNEGNVIKGDSGEEEMTVSYTVEVDGEEVVISYQADALTGNLIKDENGASYTVNFDYVDKNGNYVSVSYGVDAKGNMVKTSSGDLGYEVSYTYVNRYGNSATQSLFIVLDQKAPLVWIKTPTNDQTIESGMVDVVWYVSVTGDSADFVLQDTLSVQGLEKGGNTIVRFYIDKAGNMASDTVYVIMKNAKDLMVDTEEPVTVVNADSVEKYYSVNPPKSGETYAVSMYNASTEKESEVLTGGSYKAKEGSGEEPYPGLEGHLGPTIALEMKVPVYTSVGGLATLDDLVGKDGKVSLDGVDAKDGKKMDVEDYVDKYCTTDFAVSYASDYSRANLYHTYIKVKVWVFTSLGTFVDYFSFKQELDDPDYVNEGGLLKMYFEQKPDKDGYVRTASGKLYATGAYIYKTEVEMLSTAQCTLPPVDESTGVKKGSHRKTTDDMLKPFGYRRPRD